tara:strand:+ start:2369 stop:2635 length:267 start_codon:yes stop_codon:yes gene_type:complete
MSQLEKQDFEEIDMLRVLLATTVSESGQTALQIKLLESDLDELTSKMKENAVKFKDLLQQEQTLIKRLSEKYGAGTINFETGEFTPEK